MPKLSKTWLNNWAARVDKMREQFAETYRPQPNFCEQLKRFNEERQREFGRAPTPDAPLPIRDSNKQADG